MRILRKSNEKKIQNRIQSTGTNNLKYVNDNSVQKQSTKQRKFNHKLNDLKMKSHKSFKAENISVLPFRIEENTTEKYFPSFSTTKSRGKSSHNIDDKKKRTNQKRMFVIY